VSSLRDDWTRDAEGNFVDWTKPPHRHPGSGILVLLLKSEAPCDMTPDIHSKRLTEYCTLVKRDFQRRRVQKK